MRDHDKGVGEMNRRGIFVTLTACLILLVIAALIYVNGERASRTSEVETQYMKHKMIADYGKDIESIYLPPLIAWAEKQALVEISQEVSGGAATVTDLSAALEEVVMTGQLGGSPVMSFTLPQMVNETTDTLTVPVAVSDFLYSVDSIEQINTTHIRIVSHISYDLNASSKMWRDDSMVKLSYDRQVETVLSVYGLSHPGYGGSPIIDLYFVKPGQPCILGYIQTSIPAFDCGSVAGLCPYSALALCS
jgi:hypothetical protein